MDVDIWVVGTGCEYTSFSSLVIKVSRAFLPQYIAPVEPNQNRLVSVHGQLVQERAVTRGSESSKKMLNPNTNPMLFLVIHPHPRPRSILEYSVSVTGLGFLANPTSSMMVENDDVDILYGVQVD